MNPGHSTNVDSYLLTEREDIYLTLSILTLYVLVLIGSISQRSYNICLPRNKKVILIILSPLIVPNHTVTYKLKNVPQIQYVDCIQFSLDEMLYRI